MSYNQFNNIRMHEPTKMKNKQERINSTVKCQLLLWFMKENRRR